MNVAGAIHAAGSRPLKDFTWGPIVVNIINSLVDDIDPPVTIESTGKSIIRMLDKRSDMEKNIILSYPISAIDEEGKLVVEPVKEKKNDFASLIIASALVMIIMSFLLTYLQANIAYNADKSLITFIDAITNLIKQFTSS